jgi:hypothetical protein
MPSDLQSAAFAIPPWLNEDVEHDAVLIHGAPQIVLHALDPDAHFIKVPSVAGPRTTTTQSFGKALAEFLAPVPNGLVGENNAPFSQKQLDIPQAEAEHVIQSDGMADDLGGKAMAIVWVGRGFMPPVLPVSSPFARPA